MNVQHEEDLNNEVTDAVYNNTDRDEVFSDDDAKVHRESEIVLDDEILSDDILNESDVSDSFDDSEDSESHGESIRARIAAWATSYSISQVALAALLSILRQSGLDLSKDPRTLQSTPKMVDIKSIAGGSYYHFGVANSLCSKLHNMICKTVIKTLTLNINVDTGTGSEY